MIDENLAGVQVGEVLAGKYRIDRVLGAGGMGVVVQATHVMLEDRVALKFLHPDILSNDTITKRFLREAQSAARIKNPHVARVIDVGTLESGSPYMVMEYLEGQDLAGVVGDQGMLPVDLAVTYTLQTCEALTAAHKQGIIHRDIKPANLFVTKAADGSPSIKVLDFGISKVTSDNGSLTRTQTTMGSPLYMAPEQMRSARDVDARADVWSLGVVLYEMLTGQLPFVADTLPQLITQVLGTEPVPPKDLRPELAPALSDAVLKCLKRKLDERYDSVAALAVDLSPYANALGRQSSERIARMVNADLSESSDELMPASRRMSSPPRDLRTSSGTANTAPGAEPVAPTPPPTALYIAIGGAVLLVVGALGFVLTRPGDAPPKPAAEPSVAATAEQTASAAALPAPQISAAPAPSASASAAPTASAKPAAPVRINAPAPRPKPTTKSTDDRY